MRLNRVTRIRRLNETKLVLYSLPAQKGHTKWGGKKRGSKNVKTLRWEAIGNKVCNEWAERYVTEVDALPTTDFLDRFEKIIEYFKPKLQRSEIKAEMDLRERIGNLFPDTKEIESYARESDKP